MKYRFFKCNVLGGFRLSDLNKNVKQGEYFYIDSHVTDTSKAASAALREKWMVEVSEKEAARFIDVPREVLHGGVQDTQIRKRGAVNQSQNVATPNVQEVNKNLESRQTEKNNHNKPLTPDFEQVKKNIKERQEGSINKIGSSGDLEIAKQMKDTEVLPIPELKEEEKELEKDFEEEKEELIKEALEDEKKEAKEDLVKELEKEVETEKEETVKKLANDEIFDNSQLSTPNFDEKKKDKEVKEEVKEKLDTEVKKKKRKYTRRKKKNQETEQKTESPKEE